MCNPFLFLNMIYPIGECHYLLTRLMIVSVLCLYQHGLTVILPRFNDAMHNNILIDS